MYNIDYIFSIKESVPDNDDNFQEFRLQALDVINDVVFVIGSNECFNEVTILKKEKINNYK